MFTIISKTIIFAAIASLAVVNGAISEADFKPADILDYDVCIIGGGSAGTYAAIRLRDEHKSVAVVETKNRLGGHTETYRDPATNITINIGVILFHNLKIVKDYFGRFSIPVGLADTSAPGVTTKYVDFSTGKIVPGYNPPNGSAAIAAYAAQVAKYPYLEQSLGNIPSPVPGDLLLTFGAFIKKYSLQDAVSFFSGYGQGFGNILNLPTLYAIKYFSAGLLEALQSGFLTTTRHDNSELYEKAQVEMGRDVFLSSSLLEMDRSNPKVAKLVIETPKGIKLIRAKKIVSTISPVLNNLHGFDLDQEEDSIFKHFRSHGYYAGILNNSGIPDNLSLINVGVHTVYNLPVLPAAYTISPSRASGQHLFQFGTRDNQVLSNVHVQADIIASLTRMRAVGTLPTTSNAVPGFSIFSSHTPYEVYVTMEQISKGFYGRLFELQGKRNTYWTGAAFVTHDSTNIWQYTETLISKVTS